MTTKRKICPTELDMSDRNNNKTQDMSDRDIIMLDNICPTKIIQRKATSYLRLFVCVHESLG